MKIMMMMMRKKMMRKVMTITMKMTISIRIAVPLLPSNFRIIKIANDTKLRASPKLYAVSLNEIVMMMMMIIIINVDQ